MREVKYRSWDELNEHMNYMDDLVKDSMNGNEKVRVRADFFYMAWCHEWKLMQFTGLKDKAGREICEGDIVKLHQEYNDGSKKEYHYEVFYGKENCGCCYAVYGFGFKKVMKTEYDLESMDFYLLEVIGNKFENPELLEAGE